MIEFPIIELGDFEILPHLTFDGTHLFSRTALKRPLENLGWIIDSRLMKFQIVAIANPQPLSNSFLDRLFQPFHRYELLIDVEWQQLSIDELREEVLSRINHDANSQEFWSEVVDDLHDLNTGIQRASTFDEIFRLVSGETLE